MNAADYHGYRIHPDGRIEQRRVPGRAIRPYAVKGGYLRVTLRVGGRQVGKLVHCLVAEAFLGPRPSGHEVNHIDGDKTNNHVGNLEYVTPSENVRHSIAVLHTERAPGSRNANAKLTEAQVADMRDRFDRDASSAPALAAEFGITYGTAWRIVTRRTWRHVA
ncbi:MAG: HNH endonuclease signature motif containing protein [Nocardioides sp.]|uniref:HNH endonuclease signature motif containing protein n=1 Tax=Nocardioides sp. TaxID=35761 RepID=UPI003F10BE9D